MKRAQLKTIAYWATTGLTPASFVIGGSLSLTQSSQVTETLQHLGYPAYLHWCWALESWPARSCQYCPARPVSRSGRTPGS